MHLKDLNLALLNRLVAIIAAFFEEKIKNEISYRQPRFDPNQFLIGQILDFRLKFIPVIFLEILGAFDRLQLSLYDRTRVERRITIHTKKSFFKTNFFQLCPNFVHHLFRIPRHGYSRVAPGQDSRLDHRP